MDNVITGYKTITDSDVVRFDLVINQCLHDGWHPYGTPKVFRLVHEILYTQCMVKQEQG